MATSPSEQRGSAGRIAAVALTALVVGSAAVAGVAMFSTGGAATSSTGTAASTNPIKFVYVDGTTNNVTFVREDGTKVGTNRSAEVVGSMGDLDADGFLEVPFVTDQGEIWAIDANNETQFIANQTYTSNTKLSVADWTGDGTPEVLYANTSDNDYLYYANVSGSPTRIAQESTVAVLGVADFTDSGELDLLYMGSSSKNLWYYNESSGTTDTSYGNFAGGGTAGAPRDFYRNGEQRIPAIDGSGYVELVNATGDVDKVTTSNVDKTPVAGMNWTGDAKLEIVAIKSGTIEFTYLNGTRRTLYDANGNSISANQGAGIAGVAIRADTILALTEFEATPTGNQNVSLTLESNEQLTSLNVSVSGPENSTLRLSDFSKSGSGPYTYNATYNGSTDGDYTVTVERAESDDVLEKGATDNVTVDDVRPSVDSVSLTDATDGDGTVHPGDNVTVSATVTGDVDTVTANLSAFDAGTVGLTLASGDNYTATAQVGPSPTNGNQSATVQADDGQGNTNTAKTGTLSVDAAELTVTLPDSVTVTEDQQETYSPESVSGGAETFQWDFGDGGTATGESVTYTYVDPGTFTVTLTVTDEYGDTATATMTVNVEDETVTTQETATTTATTTTATTTTTTETTRTTTTTTESAETTTATTTIATTTTTETTRTTTATTESAETTTATATTTEPTETVTTRASDEPTTTTDDDGGSVSGEAPGFGLSLALLALGAAALLALRE